MRPAGVDVEVLIIHSISLPPGRFSGPGVEQLFTNALDPADDPYYQQISRLKVSSHFFIRRDGELVQFVSTLNRAWHCGTSSCFGRQNVNDFSIGIELEGLDNRCFEQLQYQTLTGLTRCLQTHYNAITTANIFGHQHVSPDRKTDPGSGFDWCDYLSSLKPRVNLT